VGWWAAAVFGTNIIGALAVHWGMGRYSLLLWVPFVLLVGWITTR
jgi:hypothetical protein